jgi:DNA-directed RNA polymerase sigma subunit (sigma70/sigma32)
METKQLQSKLYAEAFLKLYPDWQNLNLYQEEIDVIQYSYGLNGKPVMSAQEIADILNISRIDVQILKENTLRKIKVRHKNTPVPRTELTKQLRCAKRELFLTQYPNWEQAKLTKTQKKVVELTHGLSGEPPKSISDVGEAIGRSRQTVSKRLQAAMEKIASIHATP